MKNCSDLLSHGILRKVQTIFVSPEPGKPRRRVVFLKCPVCGMEGTIQDFVKQKDYTRRINVN